MQAMVGTFKQFNTTNLNGFMQKNGAFGTEGLAAYRARFFIDKGYILNIEELASLYHLPHSNVETPNIVWVSSKTAEPPSKLPALTGDPDHDNEISAFGMTNFRGINQQFGLYRGDRGRHIYIIGQTGAGKSGLLTLFTLSDIYHNEGYAIIDPHGDYALDNLHFIPPGRVKDVVYFSPGDRDYPIGFNPMEVTDPSMKSDVSSELIGVLKRMFGDSWGPRLEYILRYTILALLDYPNTTMLDITRMLTDKKFRNLVIAETKDPVVRNFWVTEFASWNDKFASEAVAPVLNKVGAFTANPLIRNIIGQPKSTFNLREIMDNGKIFVANLSRGILGEDNAAILGSLLVTKVQLAAMSRADMPLDQRRPFYLYVDEFQNFATDSFATILSEARKYALNLTVANQYVSQMPETVRDAVFGNVGSMVSFRVSPDDAPILSRYFEPQFEAADLIQMHNRHFIISMVIKGEKAPAFSATTLALPKAQQNFLAEIIDNSRRLYAQPRQLVEESIKETIEATMASLGVKQGDGTLIGGANPKSVGGSGPEREKPSGGSSGGNKRTERSAGGRKEGGKDSSPRNERSRRDRTERNDRDRNGRSDNNKSEKRNDAPRQPRQPEGQGNEGVPATTAPSSSTMGQEPEPAAQQTQPMTTPTPPATPEQQQPADRSTAPAAAVPGAPAPPQVSQVAEQQPSAPTADSPERATTAASNEHGQGQAPAAIDAEGKPRKRRRSRGGRKRGGSGGSGDGSVSNSGGNNNASAPTGPAPASIPSGSISIQNGNAPADQSFKIR